MAELYVKHSDKSAYWPGIDYGTSKFTVVSIDPERKLIAMHRSGGIAYVDRVRGSASTRAAFIVYQYESAEMIGNEKQLFKIKGMCPDPIMEWPTRGYKPGTKGYDEEMTSYL